VPLPQLNHSGAGSSSGKIFRTAVLICTSYPNAIPAAWHRLLMAMDARDFFGMAIAVLSALFPSVISKRKALLPMANDDILTVKEICDLLQVHQSTVYKLVREGRIPSFRIGSEWRFRKDVILRWMAEKSLNSSQSRKATHIRRNGETASSRERKG
jgi:excisionase family DNA binding protein